MGGGAKVSPGILVARYLKTNGYEESLDAFLREANLPVDAGENSERDGLTVDKILTEKNLYDLSVNFEKLDARDELPWTLPAPSIASLDVNLPLSGNVLLVGLVHLRTSRRNDAPAQAFHLISTVADRRVRLLPCGGGGGGDDGNDESEIQGFVAQASVLSYAVVLDRFLLHLDITGTLGVYDAVTAIVVSTRRYHSKYGVRIVTETSPLGLLVATAGWDCKVQVAVLDTASDTNDCRFTGHLPNPAATLLLDSVTDDILFKREADTGQLFLIVTRRDSTFLYYYTVDESSRASIKLVLAGKQNLAPYANSWNTFSASCIRPCPTDPGLIAVATSSVPHMKLLLVRLLYPEPASAASAAAIAAEAASPHYLPAPTSDSSGTRDGSGPSSGSNVQGDLDAAGSRDALAIQIHCNTMVPQTQYSVPQAVWRPDGSGVWVNSDDGVIKGIDLAGKVVTTLIGHTGYRVRCLFAGMTLGRYGKEEEILMSGAFDQKAMVWKAAGAE